MKKVLLLFFISFLTIHGFAQNIFSLGVSVEKLFGLNEKGHFAENDVPIKFGNSNGFAFSVNPAYSLNNNWLFESGINLVNRKHNITLLSSRGDLTDTRPYYNLEIPFNIAYRIPLISHKGLYLFVYAGLSYRLNQVDEDFLVLEASDYDNRTQTFRMIYKTVRFNHALFYSTKLGLQFPVSNQLVLASGIKYTNSITECNSINFHYSNEGQNGLTAYYSSKTNYISIYLKALLLLTNKK